MFPAIVKLVFFYVEFSSQINKLINVPTIRNIKRTFAKAFVNIKTEIFKS